MSHDTAVFGHEDQIGSFENVSASVIKLSVDLDYQNILFKKDYEDCCVTLENIEFIAPCLEEHSSLRLTTEIDCFLTSVVYSDTYFRLTVFTSTFFI